LSKVARAWRAPTYSVVRWAYRSGVLVYFREEPWKCVRHKARDIFELAEREELEWPRKIEEITRAAHGEHGG